MNDDGTAIMAELQVSKGDIIGVAMQQSDLPMLQFNLNGELQPSKSINRFRGTVYPSVFFPPENEEKLELRFTFLQSEFQHNPPSSRFVPVMLARGLV